MEEDVRRRERDRGQMNKDNCFWIDSNNLEREAGEGKGILNCSNAEHVPVVTPPGTRVLNQRPHGFREAPGMSSERAEL